MIETFICTIVTTIVTTVVPTAVTTVTPVSMLSTFLLSSQVEANIVVVVGGVVISMPTSAARDGALDT